MVIAFGRTPAVVSFRSAIFGPNAVETAIANLTP